MQMRPPVYLAPKETEASLKTKASIIRLLTNGQVLVVHAQRAKDAEQTVAVLTTNRLQTEHEITVVGPVNCVCHSADLLFLGLASSQVLVYILPELKQVYSTLTKRPPVSMTVVDKRVLVCGLKNHAFTLIDFKNNFKQMGMSWNANGNDWIQVFPDQKQLGFYRVWEKQNMTYGQITYSKDDLDVSFGNDHCVKADMMILGEIDNNTLLFYSFADK
jgi:hypothetical protein